MFPADHLFKPMVESVLDGCAEWMLSDEEKNIAHDRITSLWKERMERVRGELTIVAPAWASPEACLDHIAFTVTKEKPANFDADSLFMYQGDGFWLTIVLTNDSALSLTVDMTPEILAYLGIKAHVAWDKAKESRLSTEYLNSGNCADPMDRKNKLSEARRFQEKHGLTSWLSTYANKSYPEEVATKPQYTPPTEEEMAARRAQWKEEKREEQKKLHGQCVAYYDTITSLSQVRGKHIMGLFTNEPSLKVLVEHAGGIYHACLVPELDGIIYDQCKKPEQIMGLFKVSAGCGHRLMGCPSLMLELTEEEKQLVKEAEDTYPRKDPAPEELHHYRRLVASYVLMCCREQCDLDPHVNEEDRGVYPITDLLYLADLEEEYLLEVLETLEKQPEKAKEWEDYFMTMNFEERSTAALSPIAGFFAAKAGYPFDYRSDPVIEPEEYHDYVFSRAKRWFREEEYPELEKRIAYFEEQMNGSLLSRNNCADIPELCFWETIKDRLEMHVLKVRGVDTSMELIKTEKPMCVKLSEDTFVYPAVSGEKFGYRNEVTKAVRLILGVSREQLIRQAFKATPHISFQNVDAY